MTEFQSGGRPLGYDGATDPMFAEERAAGCPHRWEVGVHWTEAKRMVRMLVCGGCGDTRPLYRSSGHVQTRDKGKQD